MHALGSDIDGEYGYDYDYGYSPGGLSDAMSLSPSPFCFFVGGWGEGEITQKTLAVRFTRYIYTL